MAGTDFKYDAFISYSHKDEEWVRNVLLPTLEKQGLKVCIDYRDFIAGKPAIINMADASETSRHTLLVLTPRWVESEWTLYESVLSRTDDPSGLQRRTIPLLLEKCTVPKFISMLSWVDFTDKKREKGAWQNLFKSLDKEVEKVEVAKAEADSWYLAHPYPMPPNFTGRVAEQQMLDDWLADDKDRLFILRALGGFGKSALAWQWMNTHVNPAEWTRLLWWSFYEGDASFEHFIEETLKYLKIEPPQGQRLQVDELLKAMLDGKILLIMDGFERALRAYSSMNAAYQGDEEESPLLAGQEDRGSEVNAQLDCVNINAEIFLKSICSLPNIQSKILMTTRLTPRAVNMHGEYILGCREEELTSMQPLDATEFFQKQRIIATHTEIITACKPYGYHPLSLRLLTGIIKNDLINPGSITVANKIDITENIIQNKHHVLEHAYNALNLSGQSLLSRIACFRSPVNYFALRSIAEDKLSCDDDIQNLLVRGLLSRDLNNNRFDLHPIVRRYAYNRLKSKIEVHRLLGEYFQNTNEQLPEVFRALPAATRDILVSSDPKKESFEDLQAIIEIYHHAVNSEQFEEAIVIFRDRLNKQLYFHFGAYALIIELLRALVSENGEPKLEDKSVHAWILNELANTYSIIGQTHKAILLYEKLCRILANNGDNDDYAVGLVNLAQQQLLTGKLRIAERNFISGRSKITNKLWTEIIRCNQARILSYKGSWFLADNEFLSSITLEAPIHTQSQGITWAYRSLNCLIQLRQNKRLAPPSEQLKKDAIRYAEKALALANQTAKKQIPIERDYARAYWLIGKSYLASKDLEKAEFHLSEALLRSRKSNIVEIEANALLEISYLRYYQDRNEEAKSFAEEALLITQRCGYVLLGADVNLFIAQYALEQDQDKAKAKEYAEEALKLATCDGPPYYYKVAYEEAERLIEKLK